MIRTMIDDYLFFPLTKSLAERFIMRHRKSFLESLFVVASYLLIDKTARKAFRRGVAVGVREATGEADHSILIGYMNGIEDLTDIERCLDWLYHMSVEDEPNSLEVARQHFSSERFKYLLEVVRCQRRTVERLEK